MYSQRTDFFQLLAREQHFFFVLCGTLAVCTPEMVVVGSSWVWSWTALRGYGRGRLVVGNQSETRAYCTPSSKTKTRARIPANR